MILDVDATLVEIHSENKDGAAAHYDGGYGFHPLFCFADATDDALSGMLRPGNAAANNTADLLAVVDDAVSQLPSTVDAGHQPGDDPALVERSVVVRSDSAGGEVHNHKVALACVLVTRPLSVTTVEGFHMILGWMSTPCPVVTPFQPNLLQLHWKN